MEVIKISTEYITLQQLLKLKGIIATGGEVKVFLTTNDCYVNSQVERRRGRKLYADDVVKIKNFEFLIK